MSEGTITTEKVRIGSQSSNNMSIEGLRPEELSALLQSIRAGSHWIRVHEGRLLAEPAHQKLPDPVTDRQMMPFWNKPTADELARANLKQLELITLDEERKGYSPSIHINYLCGYDWTELRYEAEGNKLRLFGFEIMRSPRGNDGRYWESWFLPGLWAAKGQFREAIERSPAEKDERQKLDRALEFLRHNCHFGSLDVCVQRLAMRHPD